VKASRRPYILRNISSEEEECGPMARRMPYDEITFRTTKAIPVAFPAGEEGDFLREIAEMY
jgi:hypothetical protein